MTAIRTLGYSALVLAAAAFAGCGKQEETATPPPSENAPPSATSSPETPPPTTPSSESKESKPDPDKGATAPSTTPELPPKIEAPQPTPATKDEEKKADAGGADASLSAKQVAEIKKLPAGEAEQALKQQVCPVSGKNLGSMGTPFKITAAGQTFYLCCDGCDQDVKDDPAAVVAKLKK